MKICCRMWNSGIGPAKDAYNIGDNPQFLLEVKNHVNGAIWILLTRHITDIADFRQNQEYITVLVYRNDGKRVYYPREQNNLWFYSVCIKFNYKCCNYVLIINFC